MKACVYWKVLARFLVISSRSLKKTSAALGCFRAMIPYQTILCRRVFLPMQFCLVQWVVLRLISMRDTCGLKPDCCAYGGSWECSPICDRRFVLRDWKIVLHCSPVWFVAPT